MPAAPTRRLVRASAPHVPLVALLAVLLAFYAWTGATSGDTGFSSVPLDPSNRLAQAFLDGQLHLDLPIPEGLRNSPDPRDPEQRGALSSDYHDLSYFDGRLYTYWGPVPVLTLFAPARLLGLGYLSPVWAVFLYSAFGLLFSVLLLRFLVRRHLPRTRPWVFLVAVAALGVGNLAPYLLRRPETYEVALTGAFCFAMAALLLFVTGVFREHISHRRLALGSLCAVLAAGCRPPIGLVLGVGALLLAWGWRAGRRPDDGGGPRTALVALLGPFAVGALLLAVYNHARFGSFTDFGVAHQLASEDLRRLHSFSPSYFPPGLWYYGIAPPRFRIQFPFFLLAPPPYAPVSVPSEYSNVEPTGGLLPTAPLVAMLALAPFALRARAAELRVAVGVLCALGVALLVFEAGFLWKASMRYEMDFRTPLLLAATLTWLVAIASTRARRRSLLVGVGCLLIAWQILVSVMISFTGEKNFLAQRHPDTYGSLARFFSPLPTLVTQIAGHPMIAAVGGDASLRPWGYDRVSIDGTEFGVGVLGTTIAVVAPKREVAVLRATVRPLPAAAHLGRMRLAVSANRTGQAAQVTASRIDFPVQLKRGLNELRVELASQRLPRDRSGAPSVEDLVRLGDVRVVSR